MPQEFRQSKLKRYMDNIGEAESNKIDLAMAEFFYGCNISFKVCESIYFKNFIKMLRPSYQIPHRKKLSGVLLDTTHNKIEKRNLELVDKMGKKATLLIDGWQNSPANSHNMVTMLATASDQKVMLESFDTSGARDTTENLVQIVNESKELAKKRYDTEFMHVLPIMQAI